MTSAGREHRAAQVEAVLLRHPSVRNVAVLGTPEATRGSGVAAVVQLEPGAQVAERSSPSSPPPSRPLRAPRRLVAAPPTSSPCGLRKTDKDHHARQLARPRAQDLTGARRGTDAQRAAARGAVRAG